MTQEKAILTGVPETLLIPLRARYLHTKKPNGLLSDPKSVEIFEQLQSNFSGKKEVSVGSQLGIAIRTNILDEQVTQFLQRKPNSVVVNLGCGLDTRFSRIDNQKVLWYDLDVPESIELREHFFTETDRFKFIAKSVMDFSWLEDLPKDLPILFVAEGLLMYFEESQVQQLFARIKQAYPQAEILFEAMSPFIANNSNKHPDLKNYDAQFKWGIKTGAQLESWSLGIKFIQQWYFFDRHKESYPLVFRLLCFIPAFRKSMKVVHIRFA